MRAGWRPPPSRGARRRLPAGGRWIRRRATGRSSSMRVISSWSEVLGLQILMPTTPAAFSESGRNLANSYPNIRRRNLAVLQAQAPLLGDLPISVAGFRQRPRVVELDGSRSGGSDPSCPPAASLPACEARSGAHPEPSRGSREAGRVPRNPNRAHSYESCATVGTIEP